MSQAAVLAWIFGERREGQIPRPLGRKEQAGSRPVAYCGGFDLADGGKCYGVFYVTDAMGVCIVYDGFPLFPYGTGILSFCCAGREAVLEEDGKICSACRKLSGNLWRLGWTLYAGAGAAFLCAFYSDCFFYSDVCGIPAVEPGFMEGILPGWD